MTSKNEQGKHEEKKYTGNKIYIPGTKNIGTKKVGMNNLWNKRNNFF
jgi:hypothetical protein